MSGNQRIKENSKVKVHQFALCDGVRSQTGLHGRRLRKVNHEKHTIHYDKPQSLRIIFFEKIFF